MKIKGLILLGFIFSFITIACKTENKKKNVTTSEINSEDIYRWKTYRGVNIGCDIEKEDLEHLSTTEANLVRLSMPVCTLMDLEPPYEMNEKAFQKLDSVLKWSEEFGLHVLIDPHRYPGTKHKWTMLGNDLFFKDFKYHEIVINFWSELAKRYAEKGDVIAGYDLLNEPQIPIDMETNTPEDINLLYQKITDAIRKQDTVHTIVYALPRVHDEEKDTLYGYHKGIDYIKIPNDKNICLETHTYIPVPFTHQNIWEEGEYVPYPTKIDSVIWNRSQLEKEQKELIKFSQQHPNIPILVGEFSSPRWTGEDGLNYLTDVIEIAEKYNWSWAYHAYRENQVWDPEMSISDRNDSIRKPNAPRWKLLKNYFSKNK
ncbi:cellulase family glycosylhydrolase [Galbibacter sp. BG1]|uniref:glycoside hydrolase family 5 protein n=1 Tax=Galbibacter sp. BG1 TaxID=1170699 RepID=UPI0015BECC94|nr:cellulase family glycosylhydrolase [Galbibacter sp. BG1]QLE02204.1 cellulase family glycosylhydrolase [Galbibacter sp. BG1]